MNLKGKDFKAFYFDNSFWPQFSWTENSLVLVDDNVVDANVIQELDISDESTVSINAGIVLSDIVWWKPVSLKTFYKRWKRKQNTLRLFVECSKNKREAVEQAVCSAGRKPVKY